MSYFSVITTKLVITVRSNSGASHTQHVEIAVPVMIGSDISCNVVLSGARRRHAQFIELNASNTRI